VAKSRSEGTVDEIDLHLTSLKLHLLCLRLFILYVPKDDVIRLSEKTSKVSPLKPTQTYDAFYIGSQEAMSRRKQKSH
jgi:hypothetical protein